MTSNEERIVEHLQWRYKGHPTENWIDVGYSRPHESGGYGSWESYQVGNLEAMLPFIAVKQREGRGVAANVGSSREKYTVNGHRASSEQIDGIGLVFVDTDYDPEGMLERLKNHKLTPARIYSSGRRGYHPYWRLDKYCTSRIEVESALSGLIEEFNSDKAPKDFSRIMRVPYTLHQISNKPCELVFESDSVFSIGDFPKRTVRRYGHTLEINPEPLPEGFEVLVRLMPDGDITWCMIHPEENGFKNVPVHQDTGEFNHSSLCWAIAKRLLAGGIHYNIIATLFMDKSLECSLPYFEDGDNFVEITLSKAFAEVEEERFTDVTTHNLETIEKKKKDVKGREVTETVTVEKFNGDLAARSIKSHFYLSRSETNHLDYRFSDGRYVEGEGEVIYSTLASKMRGYLLPSHLDATYKSMAHLLASEMSKPQGDVWIGVQGGILNLKERYVREATPEIFTIHNLPVKYNEKAGQEQRVLEHYATVLAEEDLAVWCEQWGASLSTEVFPWAAAMFVYGEQNTGKSELLYLNSSILGKENYCSVDPTLLLSGKDIYSSVLPGKLANIFHESNLKVVLGGEEELKSFISGNPYTTNPKYVKPFLTSSYATFIGATNKLRKARNVSAAWLKRVIILKCPHPVFTPDTPGFHPSISKVLVRDPLFCSSALNLWLDGLQRLRDNSKYSLSEAALVSKEEYQDAGNSVSAFIRTNGVYEYGHVETLSNVKDRFFNWCRIEDRPSASLVELREKLAAMSFRDPNQKLEVTMERLRGETYPSYKVKNLRLIDQVLSIKENGRKEPVI